MLRNALHIVAGMHNLADLHASDSVDIHVSCTESINERRLEQGDRVRLNWKALDDRCPLASYSVERGDQRPAFFCTMHTFPQHERTVTLGRHGYGDIIVTHTYRLVQMELIIESVLV
jgi:hypothetical protein